MTVWNLVAAVTVLSAGCRGGIGGSTALDAPVTRTTVVVPASAPTRASTPAPTSTSTPTTTTTTAGGEREVEAGLDEIENGVDECFRLPSVCDVSAVAAPGSPAAGHLTDLLSYYLRNGLVSRKVTALRYVVAETITLVGIDRARVTLCEVDGSWQMDSAGTLDTSDDIVVNDRLVSRRATHELIRLDGRWLRWEIVELELWIGENRCLAKSLP